MCLSIYVYPCRYLYMDVTFHLSVCPQGDVCVCVCVPLHLCGSVDDLYEDDANSKDGNSNPIFLVGEI